MFVKLSSADLKPYKLWFLFFLLIVILYALLVDFLLENRNEREKQYLEASMSRLDSRTDATIRSLRNFSQYVFESTVNIPEVTSIVCRAHESDSAEQERLEEPLHDMMLPEYELLKKYDFRQFQFHFPDSVSFLRMHARDNFGDNLYDVRPTVRVANETKVPVSGYEEGRVLNGYRFVYPLFHEKRHCGSVELSFSMGSLLEVLRTLSKADFLFAVKRSVAESTVFADQMGNYSASTFSPDYLFDNEVLRGSRHAALFRSSSIHIDGLLARGESFEFLQRHAGRTYLVLFKSVKNIGREHVAYIISISEDTLMDRISSNFLVSLASATVAFLFVVLFFVIAIRERVRLKWISRTDLLTNIPNRHALLGNAAIELARSIRYKGPLSLVLLDIDHFKKFNDEHGHNEGDRVLRMTADVMKNVLRKMDCIGRWGGEEFIVLLPHTGLEGAHTTAEKIRLSVASSDIGRFRGVTISLGVAEFRTKETFESLVGRADAAMYRAKSEGRNRTMRAD